jgi:O-antigen ligase
MLNNYKINLLDISLIFLSISLCLWSTTWNFLDLIKSSYLLYISIILISVVIILTNFNLRKIDNTVFFFLTFFLLINFIYYLFGLFEYFIKNQNISYINEYYLKQNISIIFSLLFYKFIFNEKNIDKFIQYSILSYFVIFLVLIYFYLYVFKADFIGVQIDLEAGKTRVNKNTFGTFLNLLLPFLITYIFKKKKYLSGSIFIILYLIIILKIDSSTSLIIFLFQITLYLIMYFKKLLLTFSFICFFLFSIFLFLNPIENESNLNDSLMTKQIEDVNSYITFTSHRGFLLDSGLQKIKNDFFLGSGIETFRIRDDNNGSLTETHNAYLNITVSYGLPGLFLYLFFYYFLFKKIYKKNNMNISNYDGACIVYIFTLIAILNAVNIEYSTSIWILNSICLSRAYSKK